MGNSGRLYKRIEAWVQPCTRIRRIQMKLSGEKLGKNTGAMWPIWKNMWVAMFPS